MKRLPMGRILLDYYWEWRARKIRKFESMRMKNINVGEGSRFLTAIPHQFCGIGHSFCEWNTAFLWAQKLGMEFVDIPLREPWHSFLGFGEGTKKYDQVIKELNPTVIRLPYVPWSWGKEAFPVIQEIVESIRSDKDLLFVLADGQNEYDHTQNSYLLKKCFMHDGRSHRLPVHRKEGHINVAVHLRRGDVAEMAHKQQSNWVERFVPEDWFAGVMEAVIEQYKGQSVIFHIYSQGVESDFPLMSRMPNRVFHIDANEQETLFNMTKADILVMSPSGFSYLAAILSDGVRIARAPWWHFIPERKGWICVDANRDLKSQPLLDALPRFKKNTISLSD